MELFQILTDVSNSIDVAGRGMASNLTADNFATRLLMICTGLELAWLLINAMLDDGAGSIAAGIRALAVAMICWTLILNWSWVAEDITKTSAAVVQKIGKNQELGSIVAGALDKAMQATKLDQFYTSQSPANPTPQADQNWFSSLVSNLSFGQLFDKAASAVIGLFNGGIVGVVAAISIFIILLGKIALWVGIAFGPLCLAFAPLKPARRISESWVSFTFAAMMFPAVAAAVLILSGGIFDALAAMSAKAGAQALPSPIYSVAALAMAVVGGFTMLQVPRITQALFGNGLGVESPHLPKPSPSSNNKK